MLLVAGAKFGLPFLPPSKSTAADFKKGANMAITGATAMDAPFFRSLGLSDKIWNNGPISFQLQWFQQIATSVCGQGTSTYLPTTRADTNNTRFLSFFLRRGSIISCLCLPPCCYYYYYQSIKRRRRKRTAALLSLNNWPLGS
jgi:hypothetical protein